MAYDHYTECVAPKDYSGPFLGSAGFWAAVVVSVVALFLDPGAGVLGLILTGIAYCRWWLYGRLVCLGGNRCVMGLALGVYSQTNQAGLGKFDTDFGVNILPAPSLLTDTQLSVSTTNAIQGNLLMDQRSATSPVNPMQVDIVTMYSNHSELGFTGEPESYEDLTGTVGTDGGQGVLTPGQATGLGIRPTPAGWVANNFYVSGAHVLDSNNCEQVCTAYSSGLSGGSAPGWSETVGAITMDNALQWQCAGRPGVGTIEVEFEGAGVWDLYQALLVAAPFAAAAAVVCAIPVIGWIACAILIAIALAAVGLGVAIGLNDNATPAGDDPSIGIIHPGVDIVFVMGRWIYDSAHQGWNELHPVLHCQKVLRPVTNANLIANTPWADQPELSSPGRIAALLKHFCDLATEAGTPATVGAQGQAVNGWVLHPAVDGCAGSGVVLR